MEWKNLPKRYQGAEIGLAVLGGLGTAMGIGYDLSFGTNITNPIYISNCAGAGLGIGYLGGGLLDLTDSFLNRKRKNELEEKAQKTSGRSGKSIVE